jgi:hypothetical protein
MLRTTIEILKLNRRRSKLGKKAKEVGKESGEKKNSQMAEDWWEEHSWEFDWIEWSIRDIIGRDLIRQAERLHLPTPGHGENEKWDLDCFPGLGPVLTAEAMTELRTAIRKEKRERREIIEWWVKVAGGLIGILTGLVGALIGLFAILKAK